MDPVPFPRTGAPALRALDTAGYTHLGQLDGVPMADVFALHGMGPKGALRRGHRRRRDEWGPSIVGYGELHYVYESGREGDMPRAAFSPRSASHTFHLALDVLRDLVVLAWETKPQHGSSC